MNHPFLKMLRFELKSNYIMWLFYLIIGIGFLSTLYFQMQATAKPVIAQVIIPWFIFLTWIFTVNSYQESTNNQSMQMYHLIPIDRNTKFFSKQLITLIAFPLALFILTAILIGIIRLFVDDQEVFDTSNSFYSQRKYSPISWIFGHSVCTLFAIIFRKKKLLFVLLAYFGYLFFAGMIYFLFSLIFRSTMNFNFAPALAHVDWDIWILPVPVLLSAVFYGISYHLFFRRQL